MSDWTKKQLLAGIAGLCVILTGCTSELGNEPTILDNKADYSVNISLPYATAAAVRDTQRDVVALEIGDDGKVTVNDSQSVLRDSENEISGSSNYKSLRQGNTGLAVQVLQSRLAELGYYTAGVSGIFDTETEAAVRRFEQTYGTMQTGVATADFQTRLYAQEAIAYGTDAYNSAVISQYRILQPGDSGSAVYALQQRLRNLGYPITALTGTYDDETAHAVGLFYESYKLKYSEVANVALQQELYSDSARAYSKAEPAEVHQSGEDSNFVNVTLNNTLELQERLVSLGYLHGNITGEKDVKTMVAVKLLQEACGMIPDGDVTDELLDVLNRGEAPVFNAVFGKYENLLEGSGGDVVRSLQQRLVDLGYVTGTPNGEYGKATSEAVRLFQKNNDLDETGVATSYDQAVLFSSFVRDVNGEKVFADQMAVQTPEETDSNEPVTAAANVPNVRMTIGSSGEDVLNLQYRLTDLGYVSSITATFDSLTERAVQSFQSNVGVEPTGIAGPTLLSFIYSDAAPFSGTQYYSEPQNYRTLELNDTGDDVQMLQKVLWKLGYLDQNSVKAGEYDEATRQGVIRVQTALNYRTPDGVAGPELQCYLNSDAIGK